MKCIFIRIYKNVKRRNKQGLKVLITIRLVIKTFLYLNKSIERGSINV